MADEPLSVRMSVADELESGPKYEVELEDWFPSLVAVLDTTRPTPSSSVGLATGESSAGLNRLPSPLAMTPGCIPRNGVSKLIVPKMR